MRRKPFLAVAIVAVCGALFGACAGDTDKKNTDGEKIVLTALYYEGLERFEALVEDTYPDIDLQIETSTLSTYNSDCLRRLKNERGKDLVFTSIPNGEIAEYMLDLSSNNFTTRFVNSTMETIRRDSKTLYLPMPSVYRGFIINKTLVESVGAEVPETQQAFLDMLGTVKESGTGVNSEGYCFAIEDVDGVAVGEWMLGVAVPDFLGTMEGERWAVDFLEKKAKAQGTLNPHLTFVLSLAENGYMDVSRINANTMTKNATDTLGDMVERKLVSCYGTSTLLEEIRQQNTEDDFLMLPFLSASGNRAWACTSPRAYVGINAALEADEEKVDAALRVLDLFSTSEGQTAILADTKTDASYLADVIVTSDLDESGLEEYVEAGYVYNLDRFRSDILWLVGRNIMYVCEGAMTMEEALSALDVLNIDDVRPEEGVHTLIGAVAEDMLFENYNTRKEETALGNLIADAVRELTGAEFAFTNGGGIRGSFYAGDVYTSDVAAICPYNNRLVTLRVKGEVIYQMLENSISTIYYSKVPGGRFLQVSGLSYTYSVKPDTEVNTEVLSKPCETELLQVMLPDGTELDRNGSYIIAVNDYMCGASGYESSGDEYTMLNVLSEDSPKGENVELIKLYDKSTKDALFAYFRSHETEVIEAKVEGRIIVREVR